MGDDPTPLASIVIPTLDRPHELAACLQSLDAQTEQRFERIILRERGPLAALRNQGLSQARAPVVIFIDDDTLCPPFWLSSLLNVFQNWPQIVGVTGHALITGDFRRQRDLFRYPILKWAYDRLFLDPDSHLPGRITRAGAFTTAASEETCTYAGPVHYLEACNMAFRTDALRLVEGFDEAYRGIGDWSEPDLSFRVRLHFGNDCLWFTPAAKLFHCPSRSGAYQFRHTRTASRLANYHLFAGRWVKPCFRHTLYKGFLRSYYWWKRCSSP